MPHSTDAIQYPVLTGLAAYGCSHLMLFALVGWTGLPLPALWWASFALIPSWLLFRWLERLGRHDLGQMVGIHSVALAGGVLGFHGSEMFCLWEAAISLIR